MKINSSRRRLVTEKNIVCSPVLFVQYVLHRACMSDVSALFLVVSAGTPYLSIFTIHICYPHHLRRQLKTFLFRQACGPRYRDHSGLCRSHPHIYTTDRPVVKNNYTN